MDESSASRLLRQLQSMEWLRVEDKLILHGFSYRALDNGVHVSAVVTSAGSSDGSGEQLDILVRATHGGTCLESERHCSYEDAAARYVELVDKYCEEVDHRVE